MKICLINNLFWPLARGGAEKIVKNYADSFKEAGHDIFIISTKPSKMEIKNRLGYNIYYLNSWYYSLSERDIVLRFIWHILSLINCSNYFAVARILKKENPDLVITHNLMGIGCLISVYLRKYRIKHVHVLHDIQLLHPSGLINCFDKNKINGVCAKIYQKINKLLLSSPGIVVSPSLWLLSEYKKRGFFLESKKMIVRNFCKKIENSDLIERKSKQFLFVGQIEKHKGVLNLVKAFFLIKDEGARLVIAGDGGDVFELKKLIKGDKRIKYVGGVGSDKVSELMRESSCLVVPSVCYENSPTVIYEAFLENLPIIASRVGGIPELIKGEYLFDPVNKSSIARKMDVFLDNTDVKSNEYYLFENSSSDFSRSMLDILV